MSQLPLFSAPLASSLLPRVELPSIEGLAYLPDFVNEEEEQALVAAIDGESWSHEYQRRRQHYGVAYDDAQALRVRPLPSWVMPIIARVFERGLFPAPPDACLVNEYLPGQGIAPHHDRPRAGPRVASLSLGSSCLMDLVADEERHAILLAPRSLIVLAGEARSRFMHGIAPRKSDRVAGIRVARSRRLSITLRKRP